MKTLGVILSLFVIIVSVQLYSCTAIYELSDGYMEQQRRSYYGQFMQVEDIAGMKWRAGEYDCFYHKVIWAGDKDFIVQHSSGQVVEEFSLVQGENKAWKPTRGARWVKGPVLKRKPSLRSWRGDVGNCYWPGFGRKPNVFKSAKEEDTWQVDEVSRVIVISNTTRTVEYLSVALRD